MKIYAIRDNVSNTIVGGLHLFLVDAVAVRFFGDIASDAQTMIYRHIDDHDLILVGSFDQDTNVVEGFTLPHPVITGTAWKAAQMVNEQRSSKLQLEA